MTVSSADFKKYLLLYLFVQWFVYKIYNKGDKSQLCGELVDVVKEAVVKMLWRNPSVLVNGS